MAWIEGSHRIYVAETPVYVPLDELRAVLDASWELEAHLKSRYSEIRSAGIRLYNPLPPPRAPQWRHLHRASLSMRFTGEGMAKAVAAKVADDAIKFLRQRVQRIAHRPLKFWERRYERESKSRSGERRSRRRRAR